MIGAEGFTIDALRRALRGGCRNFRRAASGLAYDVERVLADIDADHGDCALELLGHGVLLVFGAPSQHSMPVGQEHGRTIPLTDDGVLT